MYPISELAASKLPFQLLPDQLQLLNGLDSFVRGENPHAAFLLNGYAGTGKTSLVGAFIQALNEMKIPVVLMAPTGRAAKVASSLSGHPASTIHKRLYRGNTADPSNSTIFLAPNEQRDTIFIVDEASLITDRGSNSLLAHLVRHVYSAPGCKLILIGDEAQLPPVGESESRAMNPDRLRELGLQPLYFSLDIPLRQALDSGITHNSTIIRMAMNREEQEQYQLPQLEIEGFKDIIPVSSSELPDLISDSWRRVGEEETLIITRANWRANEYNNAIRNLVMYADSPLQRGDRIVISKNDYYWSKRNKLKSFMANGEIAEVTWVGSMQKFYGRYFCEVELRLSDGELASAQIMMRSLVCEGPSIPKTEMTHFYNIVYENYEGDTSQRIRDVLNDQYFNALQVKYAYCVTCHKAQGGQWKHIYVDMGGLPTDEISNDLYRWLYTAFTRATERLYLINPPKEFFESQENEF